MVHSPEPWAVDICLDGPVQIVDAEQTPVTGIVYDFIGSEKAIPPKQEDLQRIVACVNALRGIKDPKAFMEAIRMAVSYLGRAEHDMLFAKESLLEHLRKAADIADVFEEYT
jgi:hypothetical protein